MIKEDHLAQAPCRRKQLAWREPGLAQGVRQGGGGARAGPRPSDSPGHDYPILPLKEQLFHLSQKNDSSVLPSSPPPQTTPDPLLCAGDSHRDVKNHLPHAVIPNTVSTATDNQGPLCSQQWGRKNRWGRPGYKAAERGRRLCLGLGGACPPPVSTFAS